MSSGRYTEDTLVQRTTAEYLERELGWTSVYAYNEDFGAGGLLGRASDREVVLERPLREALAALNPGLPAAAYDDAVRRVTAASPSQTLAAVNREQYALLRDGAPVTFHGDDGKPVHRRLRLVDFDEPANNRFLCVRELWVRGDLYRRRPDLIGFVNGLPLLFIECKNIHRDLRAAFEANYSDYRDTVPHLFHHNALVMFTNGEQAKIGSITSRWEHFHEWKRLAEEEPGAVDMETLLKGVCDRRNFLDLVENFILFDDSAGAVRKIIARNHQFLGVNRAVQAVRDRRARQGRLGVFWHTQGAGKSYSMVTFTRKVRRRLGGNFTFLVLTDRDDLDNQIYRTFAGCGVVDHDRDPCRAASGRHLSRLLAEHKSYVFSLIQKFNREEDAAAGYTDRSDLVVITDEAHRTQYGALALNLRNALPNASYIGFTGTPLFREDEITRRVFGEYLSTYDFQRAVEDGATVPLYYDARGDKLGVAVGDLNDRIAAKLEELEIDGVDVAQRLERNPLRTDFQHHYEGIVTAYNREKDRVTIERTFDALLKLVGEMDEEETRAAREGLDEESLAVFDLLAKPDLSAGDVKRIKAVAVGLLQQLKAEPLRADRWQEKQATRDAVRAAISNFLWSDRTGLPVERYTDREVDSRSDEVFRHVFRAYPTVPSPYYQTDAA